MSGFTLSYTANMFILMIPYDFCLFPAQFCYIIVYIWKVKSCVKLRTGVHLEKYPMVRRTLFCRLCNWLVNRLSLHNLGTDRLENIASISSVAYVSVAADTCLSCRCLAMIVSSGSTIPYFRCYVTTWIRKPSTRPVQSNMRPRPAIMKRAHHRNTSSSCLQAEGKVSFVERLPLF
jgi:hypothetical protein